MEQLGPNAKRRRSMDPAAGEPPPRTMEATEDPPPQPDAGGDDDVDRISGLPDAILGEIVSLLSTKEAGRTQILASRWRHVWLASPLVLDGADLYIKRQRRRRQWQRRPGDDSDSSSDDDEETFTTSFYEALARAVSHILSAHQGPVRRFCIPSLYLYNRPAAMDAWLSSPALDNLQELEFWGRYDTIGYIRSYPYPLPQPPASTFRFSALRVATFGKCEILDSSVEGIHFPCLKQLGLEDVNISEGSLRAIISSCPVLESMLLLVIFGVGCLRITSNSLRNIGVAAGVAGIYRYNLQLLEEVIIVDAPCLERLLYLGKPMNLTVISARKLETIGCLEDDGFHQPRLEIGTIAIQGLNVVSLTTALSSVKILAIASLRRINLGTVIELLKCFPCLEKLYIKSSISGEMNRWRRKHKDFIKSFDIRLKTIVLNEYRGIRSQVNFASFFLLNARELESMRLEVELIDYNEAFFTEQHEKLQMEKRASRGAHLRFSKKICTRLVHVNHVQDLSIVDPFECRC